MTLRESIIIRASPERIWPLIVDPMRMAEWNAKLVSIDRNRVGPFQVGERFQAIYQMSGKQMEELVEPLDVREPCELLLRHHLGGKLQGRYVEERFRLLLSRRGTMVSQDLDLSQSGMPWFFQLLAWVIVRTGKPVGKPLLGPLKEMVERQVS